MKLFNWEKNIVMLSFLAGIIFAVLLTYITNTIRVEATVLEQPKLQDTTSLIKMLDVAPKQLDVQLISIEEQPEQLVYNIKLKNNSEYLLKYNSVHLSIPNTTCLFLANKNKLDIQPQEEVMLQAMVTKPSTLNIKYTDLTCRIEGYFEQVEPSTRFKIWKELNHLE